MINRKCIPFILVMIGFCYTLFTGSVIVTIPEDNSFHFDLITVNALFGGFLYTNYSLLVGLLDNRIVKKLKETSIVERRNNHIMNGIKCATYSIAASLYIILLSNLNWIGGKYINLFAMNVEIVYMIFLIIYFLMSIKEMNVLIEGLYSSDIKKSKEEMDELKDRMTRG